MTRQEIIEQYDVDSHGLIRSPGKFESEPIYAPHFWEASSDGCAEEFYYGEGSPSEYLVDVCTDERAEFPEIDASTVCIAISENSTGFVYCQQLSQAEADTARAAYETWCDENRETDSDD